MAGDQEKVGRTISEWFFFLASLPSQLGVGSLAG